LSAGSFERDVLALKRFSHAVQSTGPRAGYRRLQERTSAKPMSLQALNPPVSVYREPSLAWGSFALAVVLLASAFLDPIAQLVRIWNTQEEYSFGYIIPLISLFLVWQRKDRLERIPFEGSWPGFALVVAALGILAVGELSTLGTISQYALLLAIAGLALAYTGGAGFRVILVPIAVLAFMVPLPNYLLREISQALQLVSSQLGVALIRLCDISVYLEGNVIDLGAMKLQVVEACSGLRYLFPLMTLGFIAAYFYQDRFWKRATIFLSTIPITVLMNSLRIGLIGITVEYWGKSMAEGFLHDFEGWIIFMACTAVMLAEMWLLSRWSKPRRRLQEVFGLDFPADAPADAPRSYRAVPRAYLASVVAIGIAAAVAVLAPPPVHVQPERRDFIEFPMSLGDWKGQSRPLESIYLSELKLDDYLLANYAGPQGPVNFYVSWYATQANGNSAHSPRACIPGDGWEISDFAARELGSVRFSGNAMRVNRVVIQKGEHKQLVYYWFQQRGRIVTDEYVVKLWIFRDAIVRNRSDGAMVRLVTPIERGEPLETADARLEAFAREAVPKLADYVPD
jgi:exosortase D (VPLPA-CTERM-specific)